MAGLHYEEFRVGMEFDHALTRTVTEMDNTLFCALTHNPQPLHLDAEFAKSTEFGQRLVNSLFTPQRRLEGRLQAGYCLGIKQLAGQVSSQQVRRFYSK